MAKMKEKVYTQTQVDVKLLNENLLNIRGELNEIKQFMNKHEKEAKARDERINSLEKTVVKTTVVISAVVVVATIIITELVKNLFM